MSGTENGPEFNPDLPPMSSCSCQSPSAEVAASDDDEGSALLFSDQLVKDLSMNSNSE